MVSSNGIEVQSRVRVQVMYHLPYIEDTITFPTTLHAIQLKVTQTVMIVTVCSEPRAVDLSQEIILDRLQHIDVNRVSGIPQNTIVLGGLT